MITEDQLSQIKQQIIEQIKSTFPEDKKQESIKKISVMDAEGLEAFLKQNQILQEKGEGGQASCIFCSIINKQTHSYEVDQNKDAIVILEINPISNGHCLVIPKKHVSSEKEISKSTFSLAKKIAKKLQTKLNPKEVKVHSQNLFGHEIINLIPIYNDEGLDSERTKADPENLKSIQEELKKKEVEKVKSKPKKRSTKPRNKKPEVFIKLPNRIP